MRVHFTDIAIKSLKPATALYWDTTLPAFGMRVGRNGKAWVVMRGVDRSKTTFGRYPELPLSDARKEARKLLTQNPEPTVSAISLEEARDEFLNQNYRDKSQRSKNEATRLLSKHFTALPKNLPDITDSHIKKCLDKLSHVPSEQVHAYRTARCFFRWCTRPPRRYLKHSPMEGYEAPGKDRKRKRVLTDQELKAVYEAADAPPHHVIRLLILWGTRQGETACSERLWAKDGVLTIPGAHTKNGRDHAIPLLPMATAELAKSNDKHYFPSRWGDDHISSGAWSKIKREVQKLSGTKNWQLRDLRRTFRTNMARLKVPRDLSELLINHAPPVLDDIYDQYDRIDDKRAALAKYESWLQQLLET